MAGIKKKTNQTSLLLEMDRYKELRKKSPLGINRLKVLSCLSLTNAGDTVYVESLNFILLRSHRKLGKLINAFLKTHAVCVCTCRSKTRIYREYKRPTLDRRSLPFCMTAPEKNLDRMGDRRETYLCIIQVSYGESALVCFNVISIAAGCKIVLFFF